MSTTSPVHSRRRFVMSIGVRKVFTFINFREGDRENAEEILYFAEESSSSITRPDNVSLEISVF